MQLLHQLKQFNPSEEDLKQVYILFIRSILEQASNVWHKSLTEEQTHNLERIQKSAFKLILQNKYLNYEQALNALDMDTLFQRREDIFEKFTLKNYKHEQFKEFFKEKEKGNNMALRKTEKFEVFEYNTERLHTSTIIQMQKN